MYMLTRLLDNLLKLEHHAGLKKWADELRKLASANIILHLVLTKTSELNLNDKDVFTTWKEGCIKPVVLKLFCTLTPNKSIQFSVDPVA